MDPGPTQAAPVAVAWADGWNGGTVKALERENATVTSIPSRIANPLMGGVAVAMAAEEALIRNLSVEFAPPGVRVAGVRTQGMPDSGTIEEVFGIHAKAHGVTREQFQYMVAERTHRKRLPTLQEMAEVVAFIAISARNSEPLLRRLQVVDCEK